MWTEERILHWKRTGEKPSPVMVWTPEHTGLFLDHVAEDRLYALWHLIVFRGLRRGEACGQRWTDTHLDDGRITVAKQLVVSGWEVYEDDPKTDAGARTIALDSDTVRALKRHRIQQDKDREEWGSAWAETGRVFTKKNGEILHPANVTRRFIELCEEIGLEMLGPLFDRDHGGHLHELAAGDRPGNRRSRRPPRPPRTPDGADHHDRGGRRSGRSTRNRTRSRDKRCRKIRG